VELSLWAVVAASARCQGKSLLTPIGRCQGVRPRIQNSDLSEPSTKNRGIGNTDPLMRQR